MNPKCYDKGYVEFFIDKLETDPAQYKPYSPTFSPCAALVVRVPIDNDLVVDYDPVDGDGVIVVGLDGLKALISTIADMIATLHAERVPQVTRTRI